MLKTTALFEEHKKRHAKIIPFAGWKMPLEFSNAKQEHLQVRKSVGLFDVSHMGEIHIQGDQALSFLSHLITNKISNLKKGQSQYNLLCNKEGGIIDDLIVYCMEFSKSYILCVNAGRLETDFQWIQQQHLSYPYSAVQITDESQLWGQIAVQGPLAETLVGRIFGPSISKIQRFHFNILNFENEKHLVSRTGYTGEDGFEILSPISIIKALWQSFFTHGSDLEAVPVGLAARDTLRLEMKYPLYGQDMNENTNPIEMGLGWACKNPHPFIGKDCLSKIKNISRKWVGFEMLEPSGIPRKGYPVYSSDNKQIGEVTSGAFSPSLDKMIGLAMVSFPLSAIQSQLLVEIHSQKIPAQVISTPFVKSKNL